MSTNETSILQIIHITDTHLLNNSGELFHGTDTEKSFEKVLIQSQHENPNADFVLLTGDISQTGSEESYHLFQSVLKHARMPVYCVPGNHDNPEFLKSIISNCPDESVEVIQFKRYALFLVNSWQKGRHRGLVSKECLDQIQELLTYQSFDLVVLAVHHPPVLVGSKWLDELGLQNKEEFLRVITSNLSKAVLLCGHVHQEIDLQWQNIRILGTPSTCHQYVKNSPHTLIDEHQLPAYRIVNLTQHGLCNSLIHYVE